MHIVDCMARDALLGSARKLVAGVAGGAGGLSVRAGEWKLRGRVIELRLYPAAGVVAGTAIRPQLTSMSIPRFVTGRTLVRSVSKWLAGQVTAATGRAGVTADELEIGEIVVEAGGAQLDDVGLAALMFGMTCVAL